jgi:hypothetical protein
MTIIDIIKPVIMKRISLVLIIALAAGFAVTPRSKTAPAKDKPDAEEIKLELKEPDKVDRDDKRDDHFDDADSNGVNDQREDDFRNIKELKSKHKDKDRDKNRDKDKEPVIKLPEIKIAPKKKTR